MSDHDTVTRDQCGEPIVGRRVRICEECAQQPKPEGEAYAPPLDDLAALADSGVNVGLRGDNRGTWRGEFG